MSATLNIASVPEHPGISRITSLEWSLLLTACSQNLRDSAYIRSLCPAVRWKPLFDLADRHGILPLLGQNLSQVEECVPPGELQFARQAYQINLHKSLFLTRELIRVVDHLADGGIETLPYKGVALSEIVYGDVALRKAGDIDLLIRREDFPRVREAVGSLGYVPHMKFSAQQERAYMKAGYECAFDGAAGRNLLEVQWAIQPRFYAVDFDHEALFRRAVSFQLAGHAMKSPCMEDLFIILALHAAKHLWGRLIWLCDVARISRMASLDWNSIGAQAKELGIARILRVTLLLSNQLLNGEIPEAAESAIAPDPAAGAIAKEIQEHITSGETVDVESFPYFGLMLRLRENRKHQIRFLQRLVFTPGPGEWAAARLPRLFFPLYRVIRLGRLAQRLFRA